MVNPAAGAWFWLRRKTPVDRRVSAGGWFGSTSRKIAVWTPVIFDGVAVSALNWKIGLSAPLRLVTPAATSLLVAQPPLEGSTGQAAVEGTAGAAPPAPPPPPAAPVWVCTQRAPLLVLYGELVWRQ